MTDQRDTLYADSYADPVAASGLFSFDDNVASVFPDMIKRSVPGYTTIVSMTGLLAGRFATAGSHLYDLGCSLGASSLAMRQNIRQQDCRIIAVDNSTAMLERCRTIIDTDTHPTPVELVCSDLEIVRKRSALDNVLLPETLACHRQRIAAAGFSSCDVWFQCFNFASLIALK